MAAIGAILAWVLTAINIGLALRTAWKEWKQRKQERPHALEAAVRDISAALRERDVKLRELDEAIKRTEDARRRLAFE